MSGGKAFRYVHSGLPADGEDVPGGRSRPDCGRRRHARRPDHGAISDGDDVHGARLRTVTTSTTSTDARSGAGEMGDAVRAG
jgi:hypothetical protein